MRIRFINSNEPVTTFYRDLVPFLNSQGHYVEILTSKAEYRADRDLDSAIGGSDQVRIVKTFSGFFKEYNKTFVSKAVVRGLYAVHGFFHLLFSRGVDVNVFLTQPPFFHVVGYLLSKLRGQKYVCVVMDVQPQQYTAFGVLNEGSIITRLLYRLASFGYRQADGIIVIGRCMAEIIESMGVTKEKIFLIPNWTTENIYTPVDRSHNPLRDEKGWTDKFVITYGGNIGLAQYFDDYVEAAEKLQHRSDIVFVLIGGGTRAKKYINRAQELGLKNFVVLPFLHEQYSLSEIYSAGDVNFISLRENCTGLGVPSKAYNSLAVGRPIIYHGAAHGEIARMVSENEIGKVVSTTDQLVEALLEYSDKEAKLKEDGSKARELSETVYSTDSAMRKYHEVITGVA